MVTKYVQEQDRGLDVGAMLMGFLDFHGNHVGLKALAVAIIHTLFRIRSLILDPLESVSVMAR